MTSDERYGISVSDPQVTRAVAALSESSGEVLRSLYCAVIAYSRDPDPEILVQFAESALMTARLYAAPDHDHHAALAAAPTKATGVGRDVREVFADLRS